MTEEYVTTGARTWGSKDKRVTFEHELSQSDTLPLKTKFLRRSSGYESEEGEVPSTVEEWDKHVTKRKVRAGLSETDQMQLRAMQEEKERLAFEIFQLEKDLAQNSAKERRETCYTASRSTGLNKKPGGLTAPSSPQPDKRRDVYRGGARPYNRPSQTAPDGLIVDEGSQSGRSGPVNLPLGSGTCDEDSPESDGFIDLPARMNVSFAGDNETDHQRDSSSFVPTAVTFARSGHTIAPRVDPFGSGNTQNTQFQDLYSNTCHFQYPTNKLTGSQSPYSQYSNIVETPPESALRNKQSPRKQLRVVRGPSAALAQGRVQQTSSHDSSMRRCQNKQSPTTSSKIEQSSTASRVICQSPQFQYWNLHDGSEQHRVEQLHPVDQRKNESDGQRSDGTCNVPIVDGIIRRRKPHPSGPEDSDPDSSDHGRGPKRPSRSVGRRRRRPHRDFSSGSESDGYDSRRSFYKHYIRPQKYSGSGSFETFYAHFVNCAHYNKWSKSDQLAHLKACLTGEAGQVLWDSGPENTNSLPKLVKLLTTRFGATQQCDKHRMELKLRKRKAGETLSSLHQDIRRLMALAYPTVQVECRESLSTDYFIDALGDPDFALKVRERVPANLDEALQVALRLEAWIRESKRTSLEYMAPANDDHGRQKGRARGVSEKQSDLLPNIERLVQQSVEKSVNELRNSMSSLMQAAPALIAAAERLTHTNTAPSGTNVKTGSAVQSSSQQANGAQDDSRFKNRPPPQCYNCREFGHYSKQCPKKQNVPSTMRTESTQNSTQNPTQANTPAARGVPGVDQHYVYLKMRLNGRVVPCLIDSGCEMTLAP